ncbi:hypothetical protein BGZ63DRAFT_84027 [Mariannaea sp. PMI_226]|nr:hypothetical protein BGZ63DRAFT_84027 [Mariannaea sp. PMI_226]
MPLPSELISQDFYCKACSRPGGRWSHTQIQPPVLLYPSHGYNYCIRHRCCVDGCAKPRGGGNATWWSCIDHASTSSEKTASNSSPGQPQPRPERVQCYYCSATFICNEPIDFRFGRGYCIRHRCTYSGCPKSRDQISLDGFTWTCKDHSPSTTKLPSKPPDSSPKPEDTPSKPEGLPPKAPSAPNKECCRISSGNQRRKGTVFQYLDSSSFCTRHRCTEPGCDLPRVEKISEGKLWFCLTHQKLMPISAASEVSIATDNPAVMEAPPITESTASTDTLPKKQRHSRVRSMLNWKAFLRSSKTINTPPPDSQRLPAPFMIEADTPKFLTDEVSESSGTDLPDPGWHQCHIPACQERVISEDVWVCMKHLEQGLYDAEDPPGFMDCPAR